jgi:hypothetical protein
VRKNISIKTLRTLISYDPETGEFTWIKRHHRYFLNTQNPKLRAAIWNANYAGKPALAVDSHGYLSGSILNQGYMAHRVAWALHYGRWPRLEIDHINHVRSDNRISNLREVPPSVNSKNFPLNKLNTSGHSGVAWDKRHRRWKARIGFNMRRVNLGSFENKADAIAARKKAEVLYGYHPNHGLSSGSEDRNQ